LQGDVVCTRQGSLHLDHLLLQHTGVCLQVHYLPYKQEQLAVPWGGGRVLQQLGNAGWVVAQRSDCVGSP
jgi:hypothetical protein